MIGVIIVVMMKLARVGEQRGFMISGVLCGIVMEVGGWRVRRFGDSSLERDEDRRWWGIRYGTTTCTKTEREEMFHCGVRMMVIVDNWRRRIMLKMKRWSHAFAV